MATDSIAREGLELESPEAVTLTKARLEMAGDALFELEETVNLLARYIAERDETGGVRYVARGMLSRLYTLQEVVTDCIQPREDERWGDAEIAKMIRGGFAQAKAQEVARG